MGYLKKCLIAMRKNCVDYGFVFQCKQNICVVVEAWEYIRFEYLHGTQTYCTKITICIIKYMMILRIPLDYYYHINNSTFLVHSVLK